MRKGKFFGKIFGIALVSLRIRATLNLLLGVLSKKERVPS